MQNEVESQVIQRSKLEAQRYQPRLHPADIHERDDIIGIRIVDNVPVLCKPSRVASWYHRQTWVLNFMTLVCQVVDNASLDGEYYFGLHDSYNEDFGIFVFSRLSDNMNCLVPDIAGMNNYDNKLAAVDAQNFDSKLDKALFIGSSTGSLNPAENLRLQLCDWARDKNEVDAFTSSVVQIPEADVAKAYPSYKSFVSKYMSIEDQLKYKHVINVDGNTASWERFPWILNSNSLCIKNVSDHLCWFYPLMHEYKCYLEYNCPADISDIVLKVSNEDKKKIIKNAQTFVKEYLDMKTTLLYTVNLIHEVSLLTSS